MAGSIPAHAGDLDPPVASGSPRGVYPRARGGNWTFSVTNLTLIGLSPEKQGRVEQAYPRTRGGSRRRRRADVVALVYPRAHGGNQQRDLEAKAEAGLSPRTRRDHD